MVHIKSTLGSFLRWDLEAWVKDRWEAAVFDDETQADAWILETYGRNGLTFFKPMWVKPIEYSGAE